MWRTFQGLWHVHSLKLKMDYLIAVRNINFTSVQATTLTALHCHWPTERWCASMRDASQPWSLTTDAFLGKTPSAAKMASTPGESAICLAHCCGIRLSITFISFVQFQKNKTCFFFVVDVLLITLSRTYHVLSVLRSPEADLILPCLLTHLYSVCGGTKLYKGTAQYQLISIHEHLPVLFVCPSLL